MFSFIVWKSLWMEGQHAVWCHTYVPWEIWRQVRTYAVYLHDHFYNTQILLSMIIYGIISEYRCDPITGPVWPRGWVEVYYYSSMTAAPEGGEWSAARPSRTLPPGKTRYPFYKRLGGPQGWSGQAENLVPTGIRSRTVQSVVSRYTDWI